MKKILLVVDMQNDFIDGSLGTPEAQAIVPNVVSTINNFEGDIYVTLDTHSQEYMNTLEGKKLPVPHCIKLTTGWLLNNDVLNALSKKKYRVIEKHTFGSKDLPYEILHNNTGSLYRTEIIVIGLCTDICVVSNALLLRTYFPYVQIIVDASCCAGTTPEAHKAAMEVMKSCQIDVINED